MRVGVDRVRDRDRVRVRFRTRATTSIQKKSTAQSSSYHSDVVVGGPFSVFRFFVFPFSVFHFSNRDILQSQRHDIIIR